MIPYFLLIWLGYEAGMPPLFYMLAALGFALKILLIFGRDK